MKKRVLIVGYGSIGNRHGRLAAQEGAEVACVTRNLGCTFAAFSTVGEAVRRFDPSHVIIANATSDHAAALSSLHACEWTGPVLVEKPLSDKPLSLGMLTSFQVYVAYNLRFHPLIEAVRNEVHGAALFSASFHVGQYLPTWRPASDYRLGYSASRARGGGVLLDLSHELDLAALLCGDFDRVAAIGGKFSTLEIDSDDVFCMIAETARCPAVVVELNYLDRQPRRTLCLNGDGFTAVADFISGRLSVNSKVVELGAETDTTYREQLRAFLQGDGRVLCSLAEALRLQATIAAARTAACSRTWVAVALAGESAVTRQ